MSMGVEYVEPRKMRIFSIYRKNQIKFHFCLVTWTVLVNCDVVTFRKTAVK